MDESVLLIDTPTTLALTVIALWLGYWINQRVSLFSRYNIPAAVSGGLPVSALVALIQLLSGREIQFDLELRNLLLIAFFSSIGLSSRLRQLLDGAARWRSCSGWQWYFCFVRTSLAPCWRWGWIRARFTA